MALDFATVYSYFNIQMCSNFIFGNKIFCSFKKWVFVLLDVGKLQGEGGGSSSPKFWGGLLICSFRIYYFFGRGGGLGKTGWGQYFRVGLIPWSSLCLKTFCAYKINNGNFSKYFMVLKTSFWSLLKSLRELRKSNFLC